MPSNSPGGLARIAGVVAREGAGAWLKRMLAPCRRPGASAQDWSDADAALGCLREGAHGFAEQDGVAAVLDGSIHNRRELGGSGNDAALLITLHRKLGFAEAIKSLNGDFAAALYDSKTKTLWLARDRMGLKPLYYGQSGFLAFASRPRSLWPLPGLAPRPRRRFVALFAASHYRTFDNEPGLSPYEGIFQLPAGHVLRWADGRAEVRPYWSLQDLPELSGSPRELAGRYRELLLDSVSLRLGSAARPAFLLSGGMDSSSVLACAVELSKAKQHAFSSVYEDKSCDESSEIQSMLGACVERWHPVRLGTPDVFGLVEEMVGHNDEPVATATWLPHYLLCREVRAGGFNGLFGGLGGDELNAGEFEYFPFFFADLKAQGSPALEGEISAWARHHDHPVFKKDAALAQRLMKTLTDPAVPGRCLPDRARLGRYQAALNPDYFPLKDFEPAMPEVFKSCLKNRCLQDLTRETLPCCLRAEDRHAAAFGLERFHPFLDHRLAEFMFRVPGPLKISGGVTKTLLREAMKGLLPEETRTRVKKTGWNAPADQWFFGKGREPLMDMIGSRSFRERGIYDAGAVERLAREHNEIVASGRPQDNHKMFLWQLVNLELWLRNLERLASEAAAPSRLRVRP